MAYYKVLLCATLALAPIFTLSAMKRSWQARHASPGYSFLPPVQEESIDPAIAYSQVSKRLKETPAQGIFRDKATYLAKIPSELTVELAKFMLVTHVSLEQAHTLIMGLPKKELSAVAFLILFKNKNLKLSEKQVLIDCIQSELAREQAQLEAKQDLDNSPLEYKKHVNITELFKEVIGALVLNRHNACTPSLASCDKPQIIPEDLWLYYTYDYARGQKNDEACAFLEQHNALEKAEEYQAFERSQSSSYDYSYFLC